MTEPVTLTARAILFDMDGTLVDSLAVVERIWTDFGNRFDLDVTMLLGQVHGVRAEDSVARFAPTDADHAAIIEELGAFEILHSDSTIEIPGAKEFVASLPADAVALVTSASDVLARARMLGAGVAVPAVVVPADAVTSGKPSPEGYLLAASLLGVDPADTIVFEDAEAGIRAGLAAGMRVVVVGAHESDSTVGLPRIADYRNSSATVDDGVITLTLG